MHIDTNKKIYPTSANDRLWHSYKEEGRASSVFLDYSEFCTVNFYSYFIFVATSVISNVGYTLYQCLYHEVIR